jgi:hypothetical protein
MSVERMAIWLEGFSEALRVARPRLGLRPDVVGQALQGLEDGPEGDRIPQTAEDSTGARDSTE